MIKKNINNRAFTLLELLIVIGVLAILTAVVILVLNPTEMLQKSRDSRRLSELADLNRALQIASVQGIFNFGSQYTVYISIPDPNANPTSTCSGLGLPTLPLGPPVWSYQCSSPTNYRKVNSTGWVPVNFSSISIGSPLATLPVDPINTVAGGLYYTYTRGSWVLTAPLESPAYQIKYATPSGTSTSVYVLATETSILTPEVSQVLLTRGGGGGGGTQQCSGTDTSCGTYPTCQNCDSLDGCTGTTYRDYYCSSQSCFYTDYPNDSRCQAPGDSTPPVAGTVTPANTSSGSYVDTPFDVSTVFTDNESAVASCEYTINGGTNWYVATISGSGPNYTCSKNNISSFDGTVLTINMRATSGGGTTTATSVSRTVDGAAPTDGPLIATPGDQQISLSWAAATDSGSGLAGSNTYKLVFSTTATPAANCTNGTQIYLGAGTSKDHTGLTNGTTYYYRVCAYDAVNNISIGAIVSGTPAVASPPGRYWVGGTGNWSDTAHWSDSSNGAGGFSVPTATDDVYFDANSGVGTATVDVAASTKNLDFTGYTGTFAGTAALNIAGSLKMASGMTRTYTGAITFSATSTGNTITLAGKTLGGSVTFNNSSGGWTLQDAFNVGTATITLTSGSLDTNSQTITCGVFSSSNSNTRSLTLGSSLITCSTAWAAAWNFATVTGLTLNAGTSQINLTGSSPTFSGGGKTYNNVTLNSAGTVTISGANTFTNLTRIGTAVVTDQLSLGANQIITGTLTLTGNSVTNRLLAYSSAVGTARILTAATVSVTNADFQDITGAGTGNWDLSAITGKSGNCGGNSGITFTPSADQHWINANGGTWSTSGNWTSRVPLPQDNVFIDKAFGTSQTVTADMPRLGASINFTGATWTTGLTFTLSTTASIYGSLTLINGLTLGTGTTVLTFAGRGSYNFTSNGLTFEKGITLAAYGGTLTLQDALTLGVTRTLTITIGTFNANNKDVTAGLVSMGSGGTNIMGSGTWTLTGTGTVWTGAGTVSSTGSTIKIINASATAKTFAGGGKIYNNIWFTGAGTGNFILTGSNTFNDFRVDTPPHTIQFTAGINTTVTTFTVSGIAGNLMTIGSVTAATHTLTKAGGGTITCDYCSISYSNATPVTTWYATNSTNGGTNTGWTFQ